MHDESVVALVLAQRGALQDGLAALLTAIPAIRSVHKTQDVAEGVRVVSEAKRAVVLADVSCLDDDVSAALGQIRRVSPDALIVLLVNTGLEQSANAAMPADAVVLKGFPAARLSAMIEDYLQRPLA